MANPTKPTVRQLTGDEAEVVLVANRVGRIAYAFKDKVDIEPIHYVYDSPWIFGRTSPGAKLLTLSQNQWCAFETDTVRGTFDWESVVVKGPFSPYGAPTATWDYDRALRGLRLIEPATFTTDDPTPGRNIVFGIHASEISGRCSVLL